MAITTTNALTRKQSAENNQSKINHSSIAVSFLPHVHNYYLHETLLITVAGGGLPFICPVYLCRHGRTAAPPAFTSDPSSGDG